jgi:hypothetical protein
VTTALQPLHVAAWIEQQTRAPRLDKMERIRARG